MNYFTHGQECAKEALRRIGRYREKKNNDGAFDHSHLDLMQELLEEYQQVDERYVAMIVTKSRHQYENGNSTPRYVTICKKPHWDKNGIMITGSTHDATKFRPSCKDLDEILEILDKDKIAFKTVLMDKRCLESFRNEYWEDDNVRGDWDETHTLD